MWLSENLHKIVESPHFCFLCIKKQLFFFFFNSYPGIITIKQNEFCLINGFPVANLCFIIKDHFHPNTAHKLVLVLFSSLLP